jgi:Reverse transcriptase (RNA-dependent DNA polymerase)
VERLCKVGVLKAVNRLEWAAPAFIVPKSDKTVRFISDFWELNKRIKRKPFPLPKIQDLMLKLEGFQFATSLDLNMGYYHIELSPASKRLCTIVLPWGKYEYQRLPMGLCNSPDIFQEKMSNLMQGLDYVRAYIDDILAITSGDWYDHLDKLELVFQRLQQAGLKVNARKSFFGRPELEYLGYKITRTTIEPLTKKVKAILAIQPPKTKRQLRRFIGMVNYYRDFWIRRSEILAPLTKLCSTTCRFSR